MLFIMLEFYYSKSIYNNIWDLLNIKQGVWCLYKKNKKLPLKHYKTICNRLDIELTDNQKTICNKLLDLHFK